MKSFKRMIIAVLVGTFVWSTFTACGKAAEGTAKTSVAEVHETSAAESAETLVSNVIHVTDMKNRVLQPAAVAEKVLALTAADCEIVYALGAGDKLVGRGEYCDYPEEVLALPALSSGLETNIEQIIALEPDLVIMSTMNQTLEHVARLEEAGIVVAASEAHDIEGTYTSINMIGQLLGKEKEAEALIKEMKNGFSELKKQTAEKGTQKIYFEISPLEYGLWTAGKETFMHEAAELLNLKNIFDDVSGFAEVSEEQILQRQPDYIVTITMAVPEALSPVDEICSRSAWQSIPAVENRHILNLPNNELSRPGPRLLEGAKALYDFVYGSGN